MQEKENTNKPAFEDLARLPSSGRILALDLGTKHVGVAICDESRSITRPLPRIDRSSWKNLLNSVAAILEEFDANALVIGLPLESDGSESEMSGIARDVARKFALSLQIPIILQDERVTTYSARHQLWKKGVKPKEVPELVDSEAAAILLADLLDRLRN